MHGSGSPLTSVAAPAEGSLQYFISCLMVYQMDNFHFFVLSFVRLLSRVARLAAPPHC